MASLRTHKKWVRIRDCYQCQICACTLPAPFGRLEVHHIIHRCQDGSDEVDNLVTLCDLCHAVLHDHMGPTWVGIKNASPEKQESMKTDLNQTKDEFDWFLRLPIKERTLIQDELWSQWGSKRHARW